MAVTITKVSGADFVAGNKKVRTRDVAFSGSYAAGGDTVTASQLGLTKLYFVNMQGAMAAASTPTTANEVSIIIASNGQSLAIRQYENAAAGSPSAEKGAEAYITGQTLRLQAWGH
jgi:hypothetical protein